MLVTYQFIGLHHLNMYCTLSIEAYLKSNIHFDLSLSNACIISFVFTLLNVRDGTESRRLNIIRVQ